MAVIKLKIYVANLTNVMGLFDSIQVHRSESGIGGPYVPITADAAAAATLLGSEAAPFAINGQTLKVSINGGAEQTVTFESANPVSVDSAVDEINGQTTGLTAEAVGGTVQLSTVATGTAATIEITGGTSLTELGFAVDDYDNGEDENIALVVDQEDYEYDDQSGDPDNYYETRYYNSATESVSSFSDPVRGDIGSILPVADLILAKIDLAGPDGKPLEDRIVSIYNVYTPNLVMSDIGVLGRTVEIVTDQAGHAETMLAKGMEVDVTIVGTGITRRIVVPDEGSEFNLMDEIAAADDMFQIQTPTVPAAVRRS